MNLLSAFLTSQGAFLVHECPSSDVALPFRTNRKIETERFCEGGSSKRLHYAVLSFTGAVARPDDCRACSARRASFRLLLMSLYSISR